MTKTELVVYANPELLAAAVAARLVTRLVDLQAAKGSASLVLTGGSTGIAVLDQLRHSPARDAVDWSRLDVYWGDERFVPADDDERNEKQAREALLDHVPVDGEQPHRQPALQPELLEQVGALHVERAAGPHHPADPYRLPVREAERLGQVVEHHQPTPGDGERGDQQPVIASRAGPRDRP